jgi:L-Ala-D/L-Glu epimerase
VNVRFWRSELHLKHRWAIARSAGGGGETARVVFFEVRDADGMTGLGEAAPSRRYQENVDTVQAFLEHVHGSRLDAENIPASMDYLEKLGPGNYAAKGAVNIALWDLAGKRAKKPIYDLLGLGFQENKHYTSYSIGIDSPEMIRKKVAEATEYPILKLKVGVAGDRENMQALREVAPTKRVRVDANEGWKTKEEALDQLQWLAADKHVEFVEQPMPTGTPEKDMAWLKERSPLPLMADESYISVKNIEHCAEFFHSVNVKLVKAAGISGGFEALKAARAKGLKTMLGCMIESSVLISAAAHLAELTDYLDIDGNILIADDPYAGPTAEKGLVSFAGARESYGLRVQKR